MPDETPQHDGREPAPGEGRSATGRRVPAPAPPADDTDEADRDTDTGPTKTDSTDTDSSENGSGGTCSSATGSAETDSSTTDSTESGSGTTGSAETGSGTSGPGGSGDDDGVAPSGALRPEEIEQPVGERDPATGAPVTLPAARSGAEPVAPEPGAPDPAHDVEQRKREAGVDHLFPFGKPGQPLGRAHPFVFGFTAALGVITAWMLVKAATNAKSVLVMIVVAMFLAVGLNPAVERLRRFGLPRGAAVATVFLIVILFFAGFVASLVQPVSEQVTELRHNIPEYVQQLQNNKTLADWDKRYGLLERAEKTVNGDGFQKGLTDTATGIGKVAINGIFQTITILILTLYFLSSLPQIKTFFYQLAPRTRRARVALLGDEILDRIGGYVAGQFTIALIAGVCSYIFLSILGVKYALALALIVAVTDLVPLIGATIGAVIVSLVAFLTGTTTDLIVCAIFYVVYQQVENYLVYPRVMKRTVDVQPAVTIVAALVGAALLGVVGALLAIPTAAAISLLIREVVMPRQETL
ncbi:MULTISPECIES: AI-2E family transporter [Actinomadura]|uniref:AI-2E family transporter n=1 Tax=Actinomadura sp. NPDC000929 TaxID=3154517 RepID=UPI0033950F0C